MLNAALAVGLGGGRGGGGGGAGAAGRAAAADQLLTPMAGITSPLALLPVGTVLMVGLHTRAHVLEGLTISQLARKVREAAAFIADGRSLAGIFI